MAVHDGSMDRIEGVLGSLRHRLEACRVTLRIDVPALELNVNDVCAESRREGVRSLKGETSLDVRRCAAFRWLDRHRRVFVEPDCLNADPEVAPEPEVLLIYGVKAEMVAPLLHAGDLVGAVSVHYSPGAREWSDAEVAALEAGCEEILAILREAGVSPRVDTTA